MILNKCLKKISKKNCRIETYKRKFTSIDLLTIFTYLIFNKQFNYQNFCFKKVLIKIIAHCLKSNKKI
jgi:hypothetical protein